MMVQRILTLIKEAEAKFAETGRPLLDIEEFVAEHLAESGVIAPPCKVGDKVYFHHIIGTNEDGTPIEQVRTGIIHKIQIEKDNQIWLGVSFGIWYCCRPYTDFYLTEEKAEQALQKRGVSDAR